MKRLMLTLMAACGFLFQAPAKETLTLKTAPDQTAVLTGTPQDVVVKIDLAGAANPKSRRVPLNLAIVLDRSGSMTGAKIEKARQAAVMAVDQLAPGDIFSLVAYDSQIEVVVPAQSIHDKDAIKREIERIQPRGNTALYGGVDRGARELEAFFSDRRVNRVLLLSDGLANVGPSRPTELRELGRRLASKGISVSTIGVGDDYNEDLMSALAQASDANYYYVKDAESLPGVFSRELGSLVTIAARDIRIEVTCPDGVHPLGFIGRTESFHDQRAVVQLHSLMAGENRFILLRCRVESPEARTSSPLASVKVIYRDELNDGRQCEATQSAKVAFTDDPRIAKDSANQDVITDCEIMRTAEAKDRAIADADAGKLREAAALLEAQARSLVSHAQVAPFGRQSELRSEIQNLRNRSQEFQQGQYNSSTRKTIQNEYWNSYNNKQQQR